MLGIGWEHDEEICFILYIQSRVSFVQIYIYSETYWRLREIRCLEFYHTERERERESLEKNISNDTLGRSKYQNINYVD